MPIFWIRTCHYSALKITFFTVTTNLTGKVLKYLEAVKLTVMATSFPRFFFFCWKVWIISTNTVIFFFLGSERLAFFILKKTFSLNICFLLFFQVKNVFCERSNKFSLQHNRCKCFFEKQPLQTSCMGTSQTRSQELRCSKINHFYSFIEDILEWTWHVSWYKHVVMKTRMMTSTVGTTSLTQAMMPADLPTPALRHQGKCPQREKGKWHLVLCKNFELADPLKGSPWPQEHTDHTLRWAVTVHKEQQYSRSGKLMFQDIKATFFFHKDWHLS